MASISYDPESEVVRAVFQDGRIYDYSGIALYTYQNWTTAADVDLYHQNYIRDRYAVTRIL